MTINYAGVDWLTMTTDKDRVGMKWYEIYTKYRAERLAETDEEMPFNNGYYAGLSIAHMRWGYNENIGYILIVSGSDAEALWERLQPGNHRVTRMDLCVDFVLKEPSFEASIVYHKLLALKEKSLRRYSLFVNNAGGATCYVGSRQSQQFGRLYDKGIQARTHEKGLKWRAEVEYKKPLAGAMAQALAAERPGVRHGRIIRTIDAWFADRGAPMSALANCDKGLEVKVEQRITTAEKKLAWLRSQVAPSVVQLVEAGYGGQVLKCLLLDANRLERIELSEI